MLRFESARQFKWLALAIVPIITIGQALAQGATGPETMVVYGAGNAGPWVTEFILTNPGLASATVAIQGSLPDIQICPLLCLDLVFVAVQPNETITVDAPELGFPVFFIRSALGPEVAIRARIYNSTNPSQGTDLSVFRVATLQALNPAELVFPIRSKSERTNLLLTNVRNAGQFDGGPIVLRVGAYNPAGTLLGTRVLALDFGKSIYIVDVGRYLGIGNLEDGHLRVEKVSGSAFLWGVMPSINADGSIAVTLGATP